MNSGKYLFSQLVEFLPKRVFDGIIKKYSEDIKLSNVAYANANRDYRIFEEFAYYMINLAQSKRLDTIVLCLSLFQWAFMTLPDRTESTSSTPTSSSDRSILADNSTEHKIGMLTYS